jgi:hypothetical protein
MRFATIRTPAGTSAVRIDGATAIECGPADVGALLAQSGWRDSAAHADGPRHRVAAVTYAPVVPKPGKIICVGLNYRAQRSDGRGIQVGTCSVLVHIYAVDRPIRCAGATEWIELGPVDMCAVLRLVPRTVSSSIESIGEPSRLRRASLLQRGRQHQHRCRRRFQCGDPHCAPVRCVGARRRRFRSLGGRESRDCAPARRRMAERLEAGGASIHNDVVLNQVLVGFGTTPATTRSSPPFSATAPVGSAARPGAAGA